MRRWILLLLVGCSGSSSGPKLLDPGQTGPVTPARLWSAKDFETAGKTLTRISDTETLVCPPGSESECFCLKQLDCAAGGCITLQENLAAFRTALKRDYERVSCELADTGKYCDLDYFRFEGDIYRLEVRYFGHDGRLLGQSNATDYPEYCEGKAMHQFEGQVPDCKMQPRDVEVICSDPRYRDRAGKLMNPRDWVD